MRPGVLFGIIFIWLVCTGGRFTAPFLEDVAKFNESLIGLAFGLQILFGSMFAGYGSMKADEMEMKYPKKGRLMFLVGLILFGTLGFQIHFLIYFVNQRVGDKNEQKELTNGMIILHTIARIIFSICSSLIFPILDGISLTYLKERNIDEGDYGKERLFGAVGWAIASLLIGPLLDKFGFLSVFFYSSQASCIVVILVIFLYMKDQDQISSIGKSIITSTEGTSDNPDIDSNYDNNCSNSLQVELCEIVDSTNADTLMQTSNNEKIEDRETELSPVNTPKDGEKMMILKGMFSSYVGIGFMISIITLCIGTSVVENLIFLFFQDELGGSNSICGVSILVTVIFEVPIFQFSARLLARYGRDMLQKAACIAYVVRVVGYTLIPKDYVALVLLFEPLHGVTYACTKTASVDFASASSPPGYESTGQGIMSMLQGFGIILGIIVGGWVEETFSAVILYRSYALIVTIGLIIFNVTTSMQSSGQNAKNENYSKLSRISDSIRNIT